MTAGRRGVVPAAVAVLVLALAYLAVRRGERLPSRGAVAPPTAGQPRSAPPDSPRAGDGTGAAPGALHAGGVVRGELLADGGTGAGGGPAPAARLAILGPDGPAGAAPVEPGRFEVAYARRPSDAGPWSAVLSRPGFLPLEFRRLAREQDLGRIRLVPSGGYGGRLLDAAGEPVEDLVAVLWDGPNRIGASQPSTGDGAYFIPNDIGAGVGNLREPGEPPGSVWLEPTGAGRRYRRVPATREGLRGRHDIRVEPREPCVLRVSAGTSRRPLAGLPIALAAHAGYGAGDAEPFDRGTTDASGEYRPRWPGSVSRCAVEVEEAAARRLVAVLPLEAGAPPIETWDLVLQEDATRVRVACVDERGARLGGVDLHLSVETADGFLGLRGRTDPGGGFEWALLEATGRGSPAPVRPAYWTARYAGPDGEGRMARGSFGPGSVLGRGEGAEREFLVELGANLEGGIWILETDDGSPAPPRLMEVRCWSDADGDDAEFSWTRGSDPFGRPSSGPAGTASWWVGGTEGWDREGAAALAGPWHLLAVWSGRGTTMATVPGDRLLAARDLRRALVLRSPGPGGPPATVLEVRSLAGEPVPGALVRVVPEEESGARGWCAATRTADPSGRVSLEGLPGDLEYGVLAVDPGSLGTAIARGVRGAGGSEPVALVLRPGEPLSIRVALPDGSLPENADAYAWPLVPGLLPALKCAVVNGVVTTPAIHAAAYRLQVQAFRRDPWREFRASVPCSGLEGTTVTLRASKGD